MIPSQALMIPQMSLPLGVPPPNSMVLMPHNSIGAPGGQQMAVLNALAASSGLPPGANPAGLGGPMGLLEANDRTGDDKLSAALVPNPAIMGGFPPHLGGFPPGPFPPGSRPQMHPNHMMGGPHWPPGMPGQGTFIRPPGAPALQQFGRLMPGPMPRSPQNMFNPQGPPARGAMIPGFSPVGQPPPPTQQAVPTQVQPTQPAATTTTTAVSQTTSGQESERKMSPTLLEQEYNRFVATKGVTNPPSSRNNFLASPSGTNTTTTTASTPSATENPNMEPLGSRATQSEAGQGMLGSGTNRPVPPGGPVPPGPDMGFRHPRPQMGFGNPRVGTPQGNLLSPQGPGGAMGMNRFPFPGNKGQRPFMRGRGGMDFRGPRPGFGDWCRPPHMGRDPFYEVDREYPMNRRDWDMDPEGRYPDRHWGGPHGEMENRFMGRGRMDEDFGPRSRDDEFGIRQREGFGRPRDDFGGPRKRDDFGRRDDYGGPRGREEFLGSRNREEYGGPRNRENDHGSQRSGSEEFGPRNRDEDFENGRWGRGHDSCRDNFDLRDNERESDRDRSRRRDRDRDQSRDSDRDRNRDSERQRDRDSDRDKDRDRDRDRERDGERRRGRERRERTRWNRSSSREKEQSARPADAETNQSSTAPADSKVEVQAEQPMDTEPEVVVPIIPDSVFKAPLPVLDVPAPTNKVGNENGAAQLESKSCPLPPLEPSKLAEPKSTGIEDDNPKVNRFAFPDEQSFVAEPPSLTEPVIAEQPAHASTKANRINSEPFAVNPDATPDNVVQNVVNVDPEPNLQEPVGDEPAKLVQECPQ